MNELDTTIPAPENVTPQSAPQADNSSAQAEADCTPAPATNEPVQTPAQEVVLEETAEATAQPVSETPAEAQTQATEAEAQAEATRPDYYHMDKAALADALAEIVAERQADRHKDVTVIKQAFYVLRNAELEAEAEKFALEAKPGDSFISSTDPQEIRFKDLLAAFRDIRAAHLAAEEERRQKNLVAKNAIVDKLRAIAADIDNINAHMPEVRQLQEEFRAIGEVPPTAVNDSWKNFQAIVEQIFDCLKMNKELRDLDFKKNLEIKQDLIAQAKLLTEEEDVITAFKKLQALHDLWRETGPVAKEYREDIWAQFKELSTIINKRHQDHFEERKQTEAENEAAKTAICEEIEAIDLDSLTSFSAFEKATEQIKDMQARWKKLGFASRKANNALFARFRKATDRFFDRKADYFTATKAELASNLEKKIALCERAEALQDSTDYKNTAEQITALQAEWKTIGGVARKHSDAVWHRFMSACNKFFDARKKDMASRRQEENENLAAKRLVIEALKAIPSDASRSEVIETLRDQQTRWNAIGHVPFKAKDQLYDEYRDALQAVRENFDLRESRARSDRRNSRPNSSRNDEPRVSREYDRISRALEQKRGELKTFENNLGFLNIKSAQGSTMLAEMERRSARLKDEIADLEAKLKKALAEAQAAKAPKTDEAKPDTTPAE